MIHNQSSAGKKQGGQLPVGRRRQISNQLVIRNAKLSDTGNYICVATSAGVFNVETAVSIDVIGRLMLETLFYFEMRGFETKNPHFMAFRCDDHQTNAKYIL